MARAVAVVVAAAAASSEAISFAAAEPAEAASSSSRQKFRKPPLQLFADYSPEEFVPLGAMDFFEPVPAPAPGVPEREPVWDVGVDQTLFEYHVRHFHGSQMHYSMLEHQKTSASLKPPHVKLLVLITSIWRNFKRRELSRAALNRCSQFPNKQDTAFFFLLGEVPPGLETMALEELARHEDIILVDAHDEFAYDHYGDAYVLKDPHPELMKLILSLRSLRGNLDFDFLLQADDDSFVNLPAAYELVGFFPRERIYAGNMIDSIPVSPSTSTRETSQALTMSLYLSSPSKVPIFAHGMGFIISADLARLLEDLGLQFKLRGNDDLLLGFIFRSIDRLYNLHYTMLFADHEEHESAFTGQCQIAQVIVHRMTAQRWRRFDTSQCHVCGEEAFDFDDEGNLERAPPAPPPPSRAANGGDGGDADSGDPTPGSCIEAWETVCDFPFEDLFAAIEGGNCMDRCSRQGRLRNKTSQAARSSGFSRPPELIDSSCPSIACTSLCAAGERGLLCRQDGLGGRASRGDGTEGAERFGAGGDGAGGAVVTGMDHGWSREPPLWLAILIFGSRWADAALRRELRRSIRHCSGRDFGLLGVRHLFIMGRLPPKKLKGGENTKLLRRSFALEVLRNQDFAFTQQQGGTEGSGNSRTGATYAYEQAWRIIEGRFGTAQYLLMLDHRSFVNVPYIVHQIVPTLPRQNCYAGCFLDQTLFSDCRGQGSTPCDFLWRRRAPIFAHGMGFIISSDVAQFVSEMAARVPLRTTDLPVDVAFATWVHLKEGVQPQSWHQVIHEHPFDPSSGGYLSGVSNFEDGLDITQTLASSSAIVWPMSALRWRRFNPQMCTMTRARSSAPSSSSSSSAESSSVSSSSSLSSPSSSSPPTPPTPRTPPPSPLASRSSSVAASAAAAERKLSADPGDGQAVDCWKGMGGRPEAWHLVCCEIGWESCWGGDFNAELCCREPPVGFPQASDGREGRKSGRRRVADDDEGDAALIGKLARFLHFGEAEVRLMLQGLANASAHSPDASPLWSEPLSLTAGVPTPRGAVVGRPPRFRCLSQRDCVSEAFARFYQRGWEAGFLPLRHPWLTDTKDHLFGLALKLREANDGWGPKGHEHTMERVQLAEWFRLSSQHVSPDDVPGERRCLEWDSAGYTRHFFGGHCRIMDVIAYDGGVSRVEPGNKGQRRYVVDILQSESVIASNSIGLVVCGQVFEHLLRPYEAMAQLFRIVAPGGWIVWAAPLFSEVHGAPEDYFRFTPMGAKAIAEAAGFEIAAQWAPGTLRELAGYMLGITAPYWKREALLEDSGSSWPLQVYMLLRKPATAAGAR